MVMMMMIITMTMMSRMVVIIWQVELPDTDNITQHNQLGQQSESSGRDSSCLLPGTWQNEGPISKSLV